MGSEVSWGTWGVPIVHCSSVQLMAMANLGEDNHWTEKEVVLVLRQRIHFTL